MKYVLTFMLCGLVGACGIKPSQVSAPSGSDGEAFPRTYPDTAHDPQPEDIKMREK